MKHRDWLRLNREGERICAALMQQGYHCCKQTRRLSWKVIKEGHSYVLTWLPAPVSDWSVVPNDTNPARERLLSIVQGAKSDKAVAANLSDNPTGDSTRPWAIARLLPNAQRYIIARFHNRQDASDHLRFLHRFMPAAEFEIFFDVPDSQNRPDPEGK